MWDVASGIATGFVIMVLVGGLPISFLAVPVLYLCIEGQFRK